MRSQSRSGISLLEIVVTLFIIALLAALLLPAILSTREASRRLQCRNRLRILGQALQSHVTDYQFFPAAQSATSSQPNRVSNRFHSPHVALLPYIDQSTIYARVDRQAPQLYFANPSTLDVAMTPVPTFVCPSDYGIAGTNYRVCMGPGPYGTKSPLTPEGGTGAFSALYAHRPDAFKDGLGHTIAMSEKLKTDIHTNGYVRRTDFWFSGSVNVFGYPPSLDETIQVCNALTDQPTEFHRWSGLSWFFSTYAFTWYNHAVGPNDGTPDCSVQSQPSSEHTPPGGGVYKASSYHVGGVNCLFMDGTVRFISDSVDLDVWRALSTRAGSETLSDTSF